MHPELEFFNNLSGRLEFELSEEPKPIAPNLANLAAPPSARLVSLHLSAEVFEDKEFRELTAEERASLAFPEPRIMLRGTNGASVEHQAPKGAGFSVDELLAAVEETERQTRGGSEWFGGVDVHHAFFEGIYPREDGTWGIAWGS